MMGKDAQKLQTLLERLTVMAEECGKSQTLEQLKKAVADEDADSVVSILFCGEFKRGKSSLLNAILGKSLCPVDDGIATSAVTLIRYGETLEATRYYGNLLEDRNALKSEKIEWENVSDHVMYSGDDALNDTIMMELSLPADFLKDGIILIDTPGTGGLDPRHAILTQMVLPKADVIVFVTDVQEPVTKSELDFYRERIVPCGKRNIVLVNKSDLLISEVLRLHMDNVRDAFASIDSPEVIPVSASHRIMSSEYPELAETSNSAAVLSALSSVVNAVRLDRLRDLRDAALALVTEIDDLIALEISNLNDDIESKKKLIVDLQKQLADIMNFRNELMNPGSELRLRISSVFENARNNVLNMISHEGTVLMTTEFDALLEHPKGLDNDGKWFAAQINDRLQILSRGVDSEMDSAFKEISRSVRTEVSRTLDLEQLQISEDMKNCSIVNSQLAFSLAGKVMASSLIGTAVTFGVSLLIPPLAILAGVATSVALIYKQVSRETRERKRNMIRQQVAPKLNIALTDMRNEVNTSFTRFHQNMMEALRQLSLEAEEKVTSLRNVIKDSLDSGKENEKKIESLQEKSRFVTTAATHLKLLYSTPFENAEK